MTAVVNFDLGLLTAAFLFAVGLLGVLVRRDIIFMLMSIEVMLNAAGLAFVLAGAKRGMPDGQVMYIFVLAMAAAEVSVGLGLVLRIYNKFKTLDTDSVNKLKG